jgi:hypothetical protein
VLCTVPNSDKSDKPRNSRLNLLLEPSPLCAMRDWPRYSRQSLHRDKNASRTTEFAAPDPRYVLETSFGYAVFDFGLRRITSLDKGFGFLNSVAIPSLTIFGAPEALAGGSFVLNANVHTETSFGHSLHIVSRRGEVTRSFGGGSRAFRVSDELSLVRRIALSRDNTIWVAHPNEYRIEQWDTTGRLLNTHVRRVGWFPRSDPLSRTPATQVRQIDIDGSGRVWLQIATRNPRGTVIEVLDPERLSAITSRRINGWGGDPRWKDFSSSAIRRNLMGIRSSRSADSGCGVPKWPHHSFNSARSPCTEHSP